MRVPAAKETGVRKRRRLALVIAALAVAGCGTVAGKLNSRGVAMYGQGEY